MKYLIFALLFISICISSTTFAANIPIKAAVNEIFKIELAGNPTTGYRWQFDKPNDKKYLKLVKLDYIPQKTNLVGSGGIYVWEFKAVKQGKTNLSFKYFRPWERNVPPLETRNFIVVIE